MSTGEFISVLEKGEANIPAVILYHKGYRRKAFQRERVWDVRAVETRHQESQLNHVNKPYCTTSLPELSIKTEERQQNTEFLNGSVQTHAASAATGLDKTPDTPPSQFSPVLNSRHTLPEQEQAALGVEFRQCTPTAVKEADNTTEVNKEESPRNRLDGDITRHTAEEDVASHLGNKQEASLQSQSASGSYHFAEDLSDRTEHPVILKGLREPETPPTQNKARVIHIKVTKFVLPGNQKKQGHTELTSDSTSGGRPIVCKLLELKEETLIPYSQSPYSNSNHSNSNSNCNSNSAADLPHSCEADSSPDMLTSSVMTALVPNWSSRSKKQRSGGGDASVNPPGQEMNRRGQEVHTSTSFFTRHVAQQPFCAEPKPQTADVCPGMSNKENAHSMSTSGSSLGSLTGSNLFNLRNHEPAKRRVSRAYTAGMPGGKATVETAPAHPLTSPVETVLRPVSPHSQDLRWSRTISQTTPFATTTNSSSPTTGSLLLSLRKMNISSKSTGTPSSPTSSLASQNKKENRMSEPLSYVTLQRNRMNPELRSPQPNAINKPKGGSEFFPLSPANEERQREGLRPRMFLYPNNNNFEVSNSSSSPYTTSSTDKALSPPSLQYSNVMNVTKNNPLSPAPGSMLRRQHAVEGEGLQQSNAFHTPGLRHTMSNVADTLNNNNGVGTMLSKENIGMGTHSHPADIYSGVSRAYDRLNQNTLAHQTDGSVLRSPPSLANFNIYSKSNGYSQTIDVRCLSNRSKSVSPAASPQITTSSKIGATNLPSSLQLKDSTNKTSPLNTPRPLFMRDSSITDNPLISPDKTHVPLDRSASLPLWQRKVEDHPSNMRQSPLTQDAVERPDLLSQSRPRGICAPITFSSLRHSPASPTSPAPVSSLLLSQKREDPFSPPLAQEQNKNLTNIFESSRRQLSSPGKSENPMKGNESSSRNLSKPGPSENLRSGFEASSKHLPSPASKFTFDLSATERLRSLSKTDSPITPVSLGSPHSAREKERPSVTSSPYDSLRSPWYIPSSTSPSPVSQKLERSSSLGSTLNRLEPVEMGSTAVPALHSPYLLLRSAEEKPKAVDLWPQHRTLPLETQGNAYRMPTTQSVSTTQYMTHAKSLDSLSPFQPLRSPQQPEIQACKQHDDKTTIVRNDSVDRGLPIRAETEKKSQLDPSVRITQTQSTKDGKDVTDSQDQKWSLYLSKTQRDSTSRGKENKPLTQSVEKPKKNLVGSRFDVMLDHFKQSFSIKHKDEAVLKTEAPSSSLRPPGSESVKDCQQTLQYGTQPSLKEAPFNSVTKNIISPGLAKPDQITTKPPKGKKRDDSLFKVPQVPQVGEHNTKQQQNHRTSYVNQYATLPANWRTSKGSSNHSSLMEFYKVDTESLKNFSSTSQPRRKPTSLCESKNDGLYNNALDQEGLLPNVGQLSSQTDIKYGLNQRRSFSVSSVQSSRPSGPGRISRSSSRTSSISDLTTLDDLESFGMADDQQSGKYTTLQIGQNNKSPERIWSPVSLERTSFPWEKDSDPTPPPSPPFSHSPRRLSKGPSPSSPGSRMSQDNLSCPRGHLPSKGYACNLSVFEESSSDCDSTTDDEYYLDGDGDETEL